MPHRSRILAPVDSASKTRLSVWRICFSLWMLASLVNAVHVLRRPDARQFFGFWIVVLTIVAAVGSLVALGIIAFRKITGSAVADTSRRIL